MNSTEPDPSRSSPSLSLSCVLEKTNPAVERRRSCEKDDARTFAEDLQGAGAKTKNKISLRRMGCSDQKVHCLRGSSARSVPRLEEGVASLSPSSP